MNSRQILIKAKATITPDTWYCGGRDEDRGRWGPHKVCAAVAIERIASGTESHRPLDRLSKAIGGGSIMAWNDDPDRTIEEVWAAYDRALATPAK